MVRAGLGTLAGLSLASSGGAVIAALQAQATDTPSDTKWLWFAALAFLGAGIITGATALLLFRGDSWGSRVQITADHRAVVSSQQQGGQTAHTINLYSSGGITQEEVAHAQRVLGKQDLLDRFVSESGRFRLGTDLLNQGFSASELERLARAGVIRGERVPPNPNPVGGFPGMYDGGYTNYVLTELGDRVARSNGW